MNVVKEENPTIFSNKIYSLSKALSSHSIITEDLKSYKKNTLYAFILSLTAPFYWIFGKDPFSHARVNNVAISILKYAEANKDYLTPQLKDIIKNNIIEKLNFKTKNKYNNTILKVIKVLNSFFVKPTPILFDKTILPKKEGELFVWPKNIELTKLTELGKKLTEAYFESYLNNPQSTNLPLPLPVQEALNSSNGEKMYILLTKSPIGKGGERTPTLAYNLSCGRFWVKKPMSSPLEGLISKHFMINSPKGISKICHILPQNNQNTAELFEEYYDCPLTSIIGTKALENFPQRFSLFRDLLRGLHHIHGISLNSISFGSNKIDKLNVYHSDLDPSNIFVKKPPQKPLWKGVIGDFGSSCLASGIAFKIGLIPPEYVDFKIKYYDLVKEKFKENILPEDTIKFNLQFGQKKDIWSMGLILVSILYGTTSEKVNIAIPPMPSLESKLNQEKNFNGHRDDKIKDLTQDEIDKDLKNLFESSYIPDEYNKRVEKCYHLIREMLQVDPNKRISAQKALSAFEKIMLE